MKKERDSLEKFVVLKADEFLAKGEESSLLKEVTDEIIEDERKAVLDRFRIERDNALNKVGHKIVGSE